MHAQFKIFAQSLYFWSSQCIKKIRAKCTDFMGIHLKFAKFLNCTISGVMPYGKSLALEAKIFIETISLRWHKSSFYNFDAQNTSYFLIFVLRNLGKMTPCPILYHTIIISYTNYSKIYLQHHTKYLFFKTDVLKCNTYLP